MAMKQIRFSYQGLTASKHEVGIAGDFTSWDILELKDMGGIYVITLPVESGTHRYKFIVDGVWMPDPANPHTEQDPFGGLNSVLIVESETAPRYEWQEIYANPSLLEANIEYYLELIRTDDKLYELRIKWYPGINCQVEALIDEQCYPCRKVGCTDNHEVYSCCFESDQERISLALRFSKQGQELFLGSSGFVRSVDEVLMHSIVTEAVPIFRIPAWVAEGVIYQIFPDRFYNGDPSLNPTFDRWYYENCRTAPKEGEKLHKNQEYFHFEEDWYDVANLRQNPYLEEGQPDWWSFYGGDLAGIIKKLDYLQDLGVTILYFNPLWEAKSNHKYDAADFMSIDPAFGDEATMQQLVKEAHQRGMKIILDVAFNHTGETFWAFRDCVERGEGSPWWNWYDWKKWPLPDPLPPDFDPEEYYQCWWGIKDMPDLNYDLSREHPAENYVKDIQKAEVNQSLVDHLLQTATWWLQHIGIDGFRLDVPDEVPYWFWQLFRSHVRSIKKDSWLVGEIWHDARGWVNDRYFDSVMNYAYFKDLVLGHFILKDISSQDFKAKVSEGLARYPHHASAAMMNLLGSHDTWRIATLASGKIARLKAALVFQMCFLGTPHIYYGDEILMQGEADPDNRRPFNWKWETDAPASEHRTLVKELISLRKQQPALQTGAFAWLDTETELLAFQRYDAGSTIEVCINITDTPFAIPDRQQKRLFSLGKCTKQDDAWVLHPDAALVLKVKD